MRFLPFSIAALFVCVALFAPAHVAQAAVAVPDAAASSSDFVKNTNIKKKKKTAAAKPVAKPLVKKMRAPVITEPTADPLAYEPSEFIVALKARAERTYWEGRKTPSQRQAEWDAQKPGAVQRVATDGASILGTGRIMKPVHVLQVAGVTFADPPLVLPPSDAFKQSLDKAASGLGRTCRDYEYVGWPLKQDEQSRLDSIYVDTMSKFVARSFSVTPRTIKSIASDVSVFTAERVGVPLPKYIVGMWSAGDAGLLLLACDSEASKKPELVKADAKKKPAKKTTAVKKPAKKKAPAKAAPTINKPEAKPEVRPGAPPLEPSAPVSAETPVTPPDAAFAPDAPVANPAAPAANPEPTLPPVTPAPGAGSGGPAMIVPAAP